MGSLKDRSGMDLTEAEDIKKRWQEYTEEVYKKDLHDPDNHLEPDILECEVKWALGSITMNKASGDDGTPVELFADAVKVLHSICQQIWKTQQWPQDWKRSVFIPIPKKGKTRECSNYCTIAREFTFTFHFHALEKEMATHSSILAWRIPGTEEPVGLPSMGSHRVRHD